MRKERKVQFQDKNEAISEGKNATRTTVTIVFSGQSILRNDVAAGIAEVLTTKGLIFI